ncbi:sensor domain-containing diguanylate cyclase [Sphingomonas sp. Mn802worker]|uniref:sensor domain-containing diguanylate cyclase n=1 Tax=Sphingomonas sp. Mn802worker TaxID=629773 RepID=UPI0003778ED3|nr:diguanylate cyclase [Sphingomonas sp. Mn802worker]
MPLRFLCRSIAAVLALLLAWPAAAQSATAGEIVATCVAPVHASDRAAAMLRPPMRFDCTTPQIAFGAGDYWVRARSVPTGAGAAPRVLRSWSVWQRAATLYFGYADGVVIRRTIDDVGAARSIALGAVFEQPIPVRGVPVTQLLWHVRGAANIRGIVANARIATPAESVKRNLVFATLYGGFGGLCLALLVYNLSLWSALRHRFQLAYCGMVSALAVYAFSSSGAMAWLWPELGNLARLRVNYVALALAAAMALYFARHFFESRVFGSRTLLAARAVGLYLVATAAAFALLAPWQARVLDLFYSLGFVALTLLAGVILVRAWREGSNYLWVFGVAWAAPFLLAAIRTMSSLHLIASSTWLDNSTLAAMTLEALVSSVAISYRIRLLSIERDAARAQELVARMLADTDPLTDLLNRRSFLREALVAGARTPQLLVLADVDHFKRVNDTLGHDLGDEVLRRVAAALRTTAPAGSLVSRIGGEEFAVLAPADTRGLPDRILDAVRATRMPYDLTITVSVGSHAGVLDHEGDWATMYRMADQALYAAKTAGRDRARGAALSIAA